MRLGLSHWWMVGLADCCHLVDELVCPGVDADCPHDLLPAQVVADDHLYCGVAHLHRLFHHLLLHCVDGQIALLSADFFKVKTTVSFNTNHFVPTKLYNKIKGMFAFRKKARNNVRWTLTRCLSKYKWELFIILSI